MAIGNVGAVKTLIEGFLASEFNKDANGAPTALAHNQGLSLFAEAMLRIASRAELTQTSLKVAGPAFFDGTNDVDVTSSPCILLGVVAQSLAAQSENVAVLFYNTTTPTEGTTKYEAAVMVEAGGTAATAKATAVAYLEPVVFSTALSWSVVDNGADGDIETTGLGDANGVKVLVVYAQ